jgi:hypothetical protein
MSTDPMAAAEVLAARLVEENAALAALDLPKAAAMLAGKQRAVADFVAAQPDAMRGAETMLRRLGTLADENKALLERAIAAQGRVIELIARAVAPTPGYGPSPATSHASRPIPFALSARA